MSNNRLTQEQELANARWRIENGLRPGESQLVAAPPKTLKQRVNDALFGRAKQRAQLQQDMGYVPITFREAINPFRVVDETPNDNLPFNRGLFPSPGTDSGKRLTFSQRSEFVAPPTYGNVETPQYVPPGGKPLIPRPRSPQGDYSVPMSNYNPVAGSSFVPGDIPAFPKNFVPSTNSGRQYMAGLKSKPPIPNPTSSAGIAPQRALALKPQPAGTGLGPASPLFDIVPPKFRTAFSGRIPATYPQPANQGGMREWKQGTGIYVGDGPIGVWDEAAAAQARVDQAQHDYLMNSGQLPYRMTVDTGVSSRSANLAPPRGGIYGSPTAPYARLAPLRTKTGDGLFSRSRVTRNLSKEDQKNERAIKLQRAQNEGQIGAARQYAEAAQEDRAADREARKENRMYENRVSQQQRENEAAIAQQIAQADAQSPIRQVGKDGLPYSVWTENGRVKRELAIPKEDIVLYQQANNTVFTKRFSKALPPQMILQWAQNPAGAEPVIDQKTGAPALTSQDNIVKDKKTGNYGQYRPMTKYEREVFDRYTGIVMANA